MKRPILDMTRLLTRIGRGPLTGIDRVEKAWLDWLLRLRPDALFLVRSGRRLVVTDHVGARAFRDHLAGRGERVRLPPWLRRRGRGGPARRAAEDCLRATALAMGTAGECAARLWRLGVGEAVYLNLGHVNLTPQTIGLARQIGAGIVVMLHDAIPLSHPRFCRPESVIHFRRHIALADRCADVIMTSAEATRADIRPHLARRHRWVIAPLGVEAAAPAPPPPPGPARFVCLSTIEPRKNHALLLDIWERLAAELPGESRPELHLVGRRGWHDEAFFARLDHLVNRDIGIHHHEGMPDAAVGQLLEKAAALLLPSRAEGFGLPALEAAARGIPVIVSDLPVFREILKDYPVYLKADDAYAWEKTIMRLVSDEQSRLGMSRRSPPSLPRWQDHVVGAAQALGLLPGQGSG